MAHLLDAALNTGSGLQIVLTLSEKKQKKIILFTTEVHFVAVALRLCSNEHPSIGRNSMGAMV